MLLSSAMQIPRLLSVLCSALAVSASPFRRRDSLTQFAGVNIAGLDFGSDTNGACTQGSPQVAANAAAQMQHFASNDKLNLFRLPVCWQYLVNWELGGTLDCANFQVFNELMQECLATGAHCIIDIHNYARWDGGIVGQGGPSDDALANVWGQLAAMYKNNTSVVFGIMNEPHDVPDISRWAQTVQTSVTAIRNAGASSHMILLPGNVWTCAATFISSGSLGALQGVKNPDGSTTGLIFDVHQYLDNGGGKTTECQSDHINDAWSPLASALRQAGRQAMITETGGGNTDSCGKYVCSMLQFVK